MRMVSTYVLVFFGCELLSFAVSFEDVKLRMHSFWLLKISPLTSISSVLVKLYRSKRVISRLVSGEFIDVQIRITANDILI